MQIFQSALHRNYAHTVSVLPYWSSEAPEDSHHAIRLRDPEETDETSYDEYDDEESPFRGGEIEAPEGMNLATRTETFRGRFTSLVRI